MKDIGSTSFGLVIAFLLPGFAGMFAMGFWAPPVAQLFSQFLEAESNVGRFLLIIVCSLVVGLEVSLLRWLLFERFLCQKHKREHANYHSLRDQPTLAGFRAAVDEHYRYHQFWGGMAIVTPAIAWGITTQQSGCLYRLLIVSGFLALEGLNIVGARDAYIKYVDRSNKIVQGFIDGERMGTGQRRTGNETFSSVAASAASAASSSAPPAAAAAETLEADPACGVTSAEGPP